MLQEGRQDGVFGDGLGRGLRGGTLKQERASVVGMVAARGWTGVLFLLSAQAATAGRQTCQR